MTSVPTLISQPVSGFLSQSAKSWLHWVIPQTPIWHAWTLLLPAHLRAQAPQFFTSLCVGASQPVTRRLSQSANPALQEAISHNPALHTGVPLATTQAFKQLPQWATSCLRSLSHPSIAIWLQSSKPAV